MSKAAEIQPDKRESIRALEATNFFLADVQTGLGPFLAAYLAGAGWEPGRVGVALTLGGIITVVLQAPAGAFVDQLRSKRLILVLASAVLRCRSGSAQYHGCTLGRIHVPDPHRRCGAFLGPTLAAVTMGIAGVTSLIASSGKISPSIQLAMWLARSSSRG